MATSGRRARPSSHSTCRSRACPLYTPSRPYLGCGHRYAMHLPAVDHEHEAAGWAEERGEGGQGRGGGRQVVQHSWGAEGSKVIL
jgi:hypothetical protein